MSFWSGEKLSEKLPSLIHPFKLENIDCASYQLSVGEQAFVTSDRLDPTDPAAKLVTVLKDAPENMLRISPGQFAFILTHECVEVPDDALAFISMRAKYKFKGLINVSGFHVDPGWKGKLLFSIYNAGPQAVIIERGETLFLIVYSDLDRASEKTYQGRGQGQATIKSHLLEDLSGRVFSPRVLQAKLDETNANVQMLKNRAYIFGGIASGIAVLVSIVIAMVAFLPGWTGIVIARTLDAANYEIRQKPDVPSARGGDIESRLKIPEGKSGGTNSSPEISKSPKSTG